MSFKEYLNSKKIDSDAYKVSEPEQWAKFSNVFEQMHPKSFTMQKLNLINGIRKRFPYKQEEVQQKQAKPKVVRSMMKPKVQLVEETSDDAKKPVMKPKVLMVKPVMKPKMVHPIMKPKNKE